MAKIMFQNVLIFAAILSALSLLFSKRVRESRLWQATVTPLASIIGSGFLVIAPLLAFTAGRHALTAISALVILGYLCGEVMRFNILHIEPALEAKKKISVAHIDGLSKLVLGIAYVISITFYLKLLAAFVLKGLHIESAINADLLTTALLLFIIVTGKLRGLSFLEHLEEYTVNIKLAIIAGLLVGLISFNLDLLWAGTWTLQIPNKPLEWESVRTLMGALIVVQGFETSRFLGSKYSAKERISTMRRAQLLSGAIYILFIALILVVFPSVPHVSDTEIIDLSGRVASGLPTLLIVAAVMSQMSAAVADTVGSGGLLHEIFRPRLSLRNSYALIGVLAISLNWSTNVFEIVSLASRAFALYYCLQAIAAAEFARRNKMRSKLALYIPLSAALFLVTILGAPANV